MDANDFMRKALALSGFNKPGGFDAYALGDKMYGAGRPMPNIGATSREGRKGYQARDNRLRARRDALLDRMQAGNTGKYGSAEWLRGR